MSDEKEQPTGAEPPTENIDLEDRDAVGGIPLPQPPMMNNWKHSLFGCFDNVAICAITYFVPCVTYGEVAKALGKNCLAHGLLFAVPILNMILWLGQRGALRRERGIPGNALNDCCVIWCCTCCALSQEGQEVQHMEIEKRERQVTIAATVAVASTYAGAAAEQPYPPPGAQGYPPPGAQVYPPQGAQGYPLQGYPPPGAQGYPPQGYPPPGAQGYPPQGYPPQGAPGYLPQEYPPKGISEGDNPSAYEPQYPEKGDIDRV